MFLGWRAHLVWTGEAAGRPWLAHLIAFVTFFAGGLWAIPAIPAVWAVDRVLPRGWSNRYRRLVLSVAGAATVVGAGVWLFGAAFGNVTGWWCLIVAGGVFGGTEPLPSTDASHSSVRTAAR